MSAHRGGAPAAAAAVLATVVLLAVVAVGGGQPPAAGAGLRPGVLPATYAELVEAAGRTCATATAPILAAQLEVESGFDPAAVSPAGAQGIAQFLPSTWAAWGRDENGDGRADPFDPVDAIPAQGRYDCALAAQMTAARTDGRVAGDPTELMLAAYNAGPGAVLSAGGIPQNGETPDYVARVLARAAAYAAVAVPPGGSFGARMVATALPWVDRAPYVWGGGGPHGPTAGASPGIGFDCSGLVLHAAYQASGGRIVLPHLADAQIRLAAPVTRDQLRAGDVIAFADPGAATYHHIGIYLGGGQMVHAPDFGQTVSVSDLSGRYWATQTWRTGRFG